MTVRPPVGQQAGRREALTDASGAHQSAVVDSAGGPGRGWLWRLARHRLVHFLALGACIFVIAPSPRRHREIRLDSASLAEREREEATRLGKRSLSPDEARAFEARVIEDELLYREAVRLGIDQGDTIVRQRLIQKLLSLAEDLGGASRQPTDEELRACFEQDRSRWRQKARFRLVHVFGSSPEALLALRPEVVRWSQEHTRGDDIPPLGEAFPLSRLVVGDVDEIAGRYGAAFAAALPSLPVGAFSQPVESRYGWHLVRVVEARPEGEASFEEARKRVELPCQVSLRQKAVQAYLSRVFADYRVYVDGKRLSGLTPTARVAPRTEASQED